VVVAFFLMVCDLSGDLRLSFAASLLFAVNPARGEAVYWVYGVSNLLLALSVCSALLWYRRGKHLRAILALMAGLLVREDAVLLPLALLLYEYLFGEGETRRRLARAAPCFLTVAAYVALRSAVLGGLPPLTRDIDPFALVNTAVVITQRFFSLVIFPSAPVSVFPREIFAVLSLEVLLSYAVVVVYVTGLAVAWRRKKFIAFWLAWGLLWISLWFNVGQFGEYLMTEKGMYLASGGFCVVAASMVLRLRSGTVLLALITCAHFAVTFTRSTYWRDPVVFFEKAVSSAPNFVTTRYELAMRYLEEGDCGRAIIQLERAIELNPSHSQALNNLGTCYYMLKDKERAVLFWVRALEADETNAKAAFNLGLASEQAGDVERALAYYRRYLSRVPNPPAEIKRHIHQLESDRR
jgi:TPR repeat protein